MRSWTKPIDNVVDRAVRRLVDPQHQRYFFDRLRNPEWIESLRQRGLFRIPPYPVETNDRISFPSWAASRYLARVAAENPEAATAAVLEMEPTKNVAVLSDLLDIAVAVPPEFGVRLVDRILKDYESPHAPRMVAPKMSSLVARLASGGYSDVSLRLARMLLKLRAHPLRSSDESVTRFVETRPDFDPWNYHRFLREEIVPAAPSLGLPLVKLLLELLRDAVEIEGRAYGFHGRDPDYSHSWLPVLDDAEPEREVKDALVDAVRRSLDQLTRSGALAREDAVKELLSHPWSIFQRIALDLVNSSSPLDVVAARKLLMDRALFDRFETRREYNLLMEQAFPHLAPQDQDEVFEWIRQGPNLPERADEHKIDELVEELRANRRRRWEFEHLFPLRGFLTGPTLERYQELATEFGPAPAYLAPPPEFTSWVGPTSPKTAEQLRDLPDRDLLAFLRGWQSPRELMGHSREGLARELERAVKLDPTRFARLAPEFSELDPTYVRGLIQGFRQELREERPIAWLPILELSCTVVQKPRTIENRTSRLLDDEDSDWGPTRLEIARLVEQGLSTVEGSAGLRLEDRERIWSILVILTDDPDPTPDEDSKESWDPDELSINSVRGQALHATIAFALWLRRALVGDPAPPEQVVDLNEMPEVRTVLEAHLDISRESARSVRSAFGRWFPWLVLIDRAWAERAIARIFPTAPELDGFWRAAWRSYILHCRPYDGAFSILRTEYQRAVAKIGTWQGDRRSRPDERLVEHLILLYARGVINLDDDLLSAMWANPATGVGRHALWFSGQVLHRPGGPSPLAPQIVERFERLWESRRAAAQQSEEPTKHRPEMMTFGYWFAHGPFRVDWAVRELEEAAGIARGTDLDSDVVEKLAGLATQFPIPALRILEYLAEGDEWNHLQGSPHVGALVRNAISAGGSAAHEVARDVADRLARDRGWFNLLDQVSLRFSEL